MSLAKALLAFQAEAPPVHLDATNPHFGNKFASLGGVVGAIRPALNKAGLAYSQLPTTLEGQPALRTVLIHADTGEKLEDTMLLILSKNDSQGQGSALTYARRYALLSILGLVGDADDDATAAAKPAQSNGSTFTPPPSAQVADPHGLQASRADADAGDDGQPGNVQVFFGKNTGIRLVDLTPKQRLFYAESWAPNNPQFPVGAKERRLRQAARQLCGIQPVVETDGLFAVSPGGGDDSDIPFARTFS